MPVCINLSSALEAQLRRDVVDLDQTAKETLLVDLYRRGTITHHELSESLGTGRFRVEELLARYGVVEDLPTAESVLREAADLESRLAQ
jgi:hypothetical protein